MFNKTQYVVERKQLAAFLPFAKDTYNVKDVRGNLLGCFKKQRRIFGEGEFWIEGTDGTRLGEIRVSRKRHREVYDAQRQLRATIRMAPTRRGESRRFLLALVPVFMPMAIALFVMIFMVPSASSSLLVTILVVGGGLTMLGLILFAYFAQKGRFGEPKWLIENPEGQLLAEGNDFTLGTHVRMLAPDGSVIAHVKGAAISIRPSYRINISRRGFDELLVLSYAVIMAHRHKEAVSSAGGWGGFGS